MTRKAELEQAEERLRARSANLSEREKQLGIREAACAAREQRVIAKEGEVKITQEKFNTAAEALRTQWDRLREEKDRMAEKDTAGVFGATLDPLGTSYAMKVLMTFSCSSTSYCPIPSATGGETVCHGVLGSSSD